MIQELEKEQASLKRLIEDSVQNQEFLMAHFHAEALENINRQLQTLRNLEDKNFDNKRSIESSIRICERQLELDHSDTFKRHLQSQILRLKQELDQLNERSKVGAIDSDILTKYLESFVRNKLKGIKVILRRSSSFIFLIKRHRSGVRIMIPNLKALRKNYIINDENIRHFYALGFVIDDRESRLTLILSRDKNDLLTALKKIMVKIVFEIFYFRNFAGDTFIEVQE